MRFIIPFVFLLSLLFNLALSIADRRSEDDETTSQGDTALVVWEFDFSSTLEPVHDHLQQHGFIFERDMTPGGTILLSSTNQHLAIHTTKPAFGLMMKKDLHVADATLLVVSRFHFADAFTAWYQQQTVPPITGIALEVDTQGLADGTAAAFIKRISVLQMIPGGNHHVYR